MLGVAQHLLCRAVGAGEHGEFPGHPSERGQRQGLRGEQHSEIKWILLPHQRRRLLPQRRSPPRAPTKWEKLKELPTPAVAEQAGARSPVPGKRRAREAVTILSSYVTLA